MPTWLAGPVKWIAGILVDKVLAKLIEYIKRELALRRTKKENKKVREKIENAETEEDFRKAADAVAGHHRADDDN